MVGIKLLFFGSSRQYPLEISAGRRLEYLQIEFGDDCQHMVEHIRLHPFIGHPILQRTEEIKLYRDTAVGRLELAHHAGQFLIYVGKTFQISRQIRPEHTQIGLAASVDEDGVIDAVFHIVLSITSSVCST